MKLRGSARDGRFMHIRREERDAAWTFHVTRMGQTFSGHFADAVWGGSPQALLAAQRGLLRLMLLIGPDSRARRRPPKGTSSKTGVIGVTREPHRVEGRIYHRYVAGWRDADKKSCRRRFLIERYGKQKAFALAVEARLAGVAQTYAVLVRRQREEAERLLRELPPMPRRAKDPLSRKGISMANRRPRGAK